jgi:predicted anti-sigma-YlaC factor YlaD
MNLFGSDPAINCAAVRQQLSEVLDGEQSASSREVESHVLLCGACTEWREQAHVLARATRIGLTAQVPDLSHSIAMKLNALNVELNSNRRLSPLPMLRVALTIVSCGLIIGAFGAMLHAPDTFAAGHLPRELAGFEVALGLGFLLAARRPEHGTGVALVGCAVALMMVLTALADVASGTTTSGIEAHHLLDLVGALLAVAVARLASQRDFDTLRLTMGAAAVTR